MGLDSDSRASKTHPHPQEPRGSLDEKQKHTRATLKWCGQQELPAKQVKGGQDWARQAPT